MNISSNTIELSDIRCEVFRKNIKHLRLSVHAPFGLVTISAPLRMDLETIRLFGISKLGWIRKQQTKLKTQKTETALEYVTWESHCYLGQKYLLKLVEHDATPKVILNCNTIELYVRKDTSAAYRKKILQSWYRQQLRELVPAYIVNLEQKLDVQIAELRIKTMKTRWGTCNIKAKRIWLNTELAKKPIECIEYVLVHEMIHLLERHHNKKFVAHMDKIQPNWKYLRKVLNQSQKN